MDDINKIFANNVKKKRKQQSISQEKLAELCGLHRTFIGLIERSNKNITLKNAEKIAKALNLDIKDLLVKDSDVLK
ncbi:helix-turn-helix domain-containing protein [Campylobacter jejuni]|uniref:helix-turn-helix domain-containing protein n=1 Tax=Campylobacter jejuni TaxID=197 RepID=UPI000F804F90|nr:helix-turn-helix transcriptional regulator [Campylobacter jejuni]RTI73398.1 transcriptional regulator [Campylobacter jejuni]